MNRLILSCVVFLSLLMSACGPSAGQQSAISVSLTETAWSTAARMPTFTPTVAPTSTPILEPDSKAMIAWQELDLSKEFIAFPADAMGVEEGANAYSLNAGDGSILEYAIAGSFVFADSEESPGQIIYGYTTLLPSSKDKDIFDDYVTQDGISDLMAAAFGIPAKSIHF